MALSTISLFRINNCDEETVESNPSQDFQMEQALIVGEIQPLGSIDTDSVQDHCTENEVRMNAMVKNSKYAVGKIVSNTSIDAFLYEYDMTFEIRPWAIKALDRSPAHGKGVDYAFVISILWPDAQSLSCLRVLARMVSLPFALHKAPRKIGIPPKPPSRSCAPVLSIKRPRDEPQLLHERRRNNSFSSRSSSDDDSPYFDGASSSPASRPLSRASSNDDGLTTSSSVGSINDMMEDCKLFDFDDDDFLADSCLSLGGMDAIMEELNVDSNKRLNSEADDNEDDYLMELVSDDGDFLEQLLR